MSPLKTTLKSVESTSKNALRGLLAPRAIRALKSAALEVTTLEDAVNLAFRFNYHRVRLDPSQIFSEILGLMKLLASRPPATVLEIGTYRGGTFFLFSRVAAEDALLMSLDLPAHRSGLGYPRWRSGLFRSFARERQTVELLLADSRVPATVKQIQDLLCGRSLDFLFIDGDHSYEGVKSDFEMYAPLVHSGGVIGFHDIVPRKSAPCGVPHLWQQLKTDRKVTEFVADWQQEGFGIGVVHVE